MHKTFYFYRARLFPTVLTIIPILIFFNSIIAKQYSAALNEINSVIPYIADLGFSAALLFLMIQVNRFVAKEVIQRFYFHDEIQMPTTNHLLWIDDYYDQSTKEIIRKKIQKNFGITLLSVEEEEKDELKARKQIAIAISQIRDTLIDNKMLRQHNAEYGFFRNLVGGCIIAIFFSLIILIVGVVNSTNSLLLSGLFFTIIYSLPLLFSRLIIRRYGEYYSKILYEKFLNI